MKIPEWVKPAFWGAAWGILAFTIVGFWQFGWVTGGSAEQMAQKRSEEAVAAVLALICVDSFRKQENASAKLVEAKQLSSWQRRDFVEKGGWATMPGSEKAVAGVAAACAERLSNLN